MSQIQIDPVGFAVGLPPTAAVEIATASTITTRIEAAAGPILTRFGFVDFQVTTVNFFAVEVSDRFIGFFLRTHFHEGESTRSARDSVENQVALDNVSLLLEEIQKFSLSGIKRQISHI